ncbi:MAG: SAM-dependent methyltransferase [Candidatus Omnitrophica bacterium]|nr:SAM-dependent methyltransferase [Candidatus Omnitrophota bacterium]
MPAKLYLIPNTLTQEAGASFIPEAVAKAIQEVRVFFVEEPKSARALLKKLRPDFPLAECTFFALNEHTSLIETRQCLVSTVNQGKDIGIISEAGYPCVADPGADLVRLAQAQGIEVVPLAGASSIILALAASGLNGQSFAFNGYLSKDKGERLKKIKALEQHSAQEGQTQIVMEAPYRNQNLLEDFLSVCHPKTLLCVASDITGSSQMIKSCSIQEWKKKPLVLEKKPTLFMINFTTGLPVDG